MVNRTTFRETFDAFLAAEVEEWVILRQDGFEEAFSSLQLIQSFIESDVPLPDAFSIFDIVRDRIAGVYPTGRIPQRQLRNMVADTFLSYPHHDRAIWFTNYENVYATDITDFVDEDDDPEFVSARSKGNIRKALLELFPREFVVESKSAPGSKKSKSARNTVNNDELTEIGERIIRIIRQAGFYKLPRIFFNEFCKNLAQYSTKLILPAPNITDLQMASTFKTAEQLVVLSRVRMGDSAGNSVAVGILEVAVSGIAMAVMQWFGFLPKRNPVEALSQLNGLVSDGRRLIKTEGSEAHPVAQFYRAIGESLNKRGKKITDFAGAVNNLERLLMECKGFNVGDSESRALIPDVGRIEETQLMAERFLLLSRLSTDIDAELADAINLLNQIDNEPQETLRAIRKYFSSLGIRGDSWILDSGRPALLVRVGTNNTRLLGLSSSVLFVLVDDDLSQVSDTEMFSDIEEYLLSNSSTVAVIINRTNKNTSTEILERLSTLAQQQHGYILPVSARSFISLVSEPQGLFDSFADQLVRLYRVVPSEPTWTRDQVPFDIDMLPVGFERQELEGALTALKDRYYQEAIGKARLLLESTLKLNLNIAANVGHWLYKERWLQATRHISGIDSSTSPYDVSMQEICDSLRALQSVCRERNFGVVAELIPSGRSINAIDEIRRQRNYATHSYSDPKEAHDFVTRVFELVRMIGPANGSWSLATFLPNNRFNWESVGLDGTTETWSTSDLEGWQPGEFSAAVILRSDATRVAVPFVAACSDRVCPGSFVQFRSKSRRLRCSECARDLQLDPRVDRIGRLAASLARASSARPSPSDGSELIKSGKSDVRHSTDELNIFVTYSRQDSKYLEPNSLLGYLSDLPRDHVIIRTDRDVQPTEHWDDWVREQIQNADIVLALISQSFLNSPYCQDVEIASALEQRRTRGLRIFPIILSACEWERHDWLKSTQFLPRQGANIESHHNEPGPRNEMFLEIKTELRRLIEQIRQE